MLGASSSIGARTAHLRAALQAALPVPTGLRLRVVKSAVEEHDGDVSVQSAPECGTTFRLSFPLYDAAKKAAGRV